LVVISGPSGAGKTSICQALLDQLEDMVWSVSATTRPKRAGEVAGESYEFLTGDEFESRLKDGDFLEWAEYVGHRYGTPRVPVEQWLAQGKSVVMEIDVQGGIQVARSAPESIRVFVLPPSPDSLRSRLEGRNTEAEEQLSKRLREADGEIATARDSACYDYFVVNDNLNDTIEQVKSIIRKETESRD
jgi:guanylate kinase